MASGLRPRPALNPSEHVEEHDAAPNLDQGGTSGDVEDVNMRGNELEKRARKPSAKLMASQGLEVMTPSEIAEAERARARQLHARKQSASTAPRGTVVGGQRAGGPRPLWHGTNYVLSEFSGLLSNAPQQLSAKDWSSMGAGGADGDPSSSSGCPLTAPELQSLAELTVDSKNVSTMTQYKSNARTLEFFLKYGNITDLIMEWFEADSKCALPIQSMDLTTEDASAMAVRALKWAAANFPGYYEAMQTEKKPTVISASTFDSFAAALNMVYKLQLLKKNLANDRPNRIRGYPVVDLTFKSLSDKMMKKDEM